MEPNPHASIYIAPLHIRKDHCQSENSSDDSQQAELDQPKDRHDIHHVRKSSRLSGFHTYLRAFYPFQPTCDYDSSTVTLPFQRGDIILIHSVHVNGWADGTLLSSGARGWLPTNYCEVYDGQPIRNLLKALTRYWDLMRSANTTSLEVYGNHEYVRGLVAGVRCLLVSHGSQCIENTR